jgi:hypothetical protein
MDELRKVAVTAVWKRIALKNVGLAGDYKAESEDRVAADGWSCKRCWEMLQLVI